MKRIFESYRYKPITFASSMYICIRFFFLFEVPRSRHNLDELRNPVFIQHYKIRQFLYNGGNN